MHKIAIIPGDGIGQEVIPAALEVIERAAPGVLEMTEFPWGCDFYVRNGRMMDADGFEQLQQFEAIFLGAIGDPRVPDHVSVWELILPLRQRFDQYVNLRPMRLLPGVTTPLANRTTKDIDMICVRENSEGEYGGLGGRMHVGTPFEVAEQTGIFTRRGIERVARYAFEVASQRPRRKLASATKSNALQHSMVLWDKVVEEVAVNYPQVEWRKYHVDALAARMVTDPGSLDVILASNLFGDILTDLGAAVSGSLGVAPEREPESRSPLPVDVRADPRLRPGHHGQRPREPDWRDLVGSADAVVPWPPRRPRPHRGGDRKSARSGRPQNAGSRRDGEHEGSRRSCRSGDLSFARLQASGSRLQATGL